MKSHLAPRLARDPYEEGLRLSLKGDHSGAIVQFETALAARPHDNRILFALGNTAAALRMHDAAEIFYRQVLSAEPQRLEALVNLANLLRERGAAAAAIALLNPALQRMPDAPELWLARGSAYRELGDALAAETDYRAALEHRPNYVLAMGNLADMLADRGETEEALALYERALTREPKQAQLRFNRAILNLALGRLKQGWRDYAARIDVAGKVPLADHGLPRWTGASLKSKRLLVTVEQGVGDQVMFASMLSELAARAKAEGGRIVMDCDPRLAPLFARSFPDIAVQPMYLPKTAGPVVASYGWLKPLGGANMFIELGSLARYLRADIGAFPRPHRYLIADAREQAQWRDAFADLPAPHIGICWRSGKTGGLRNLQYAPLELWAEFLRDLPGSVVCTQYDATAEEIAFLEKRSGRKIVTPQGIDQKQELDRAVALLSALDLVISAPTAVSWLAAGAAVPTFKILYGSGWTSFGCEDEPFAPAARCIAPRTMGGWKTAFAIASAKIKSQFAAR